MESRVDKSSPRYAAAILAIIALLRARAYYYNSNIEDLIFCIGFVLVAVAQYRDVLMNPISRSTPGLDRVIAIGGYLGAMSVVAGMVLLFHRHGR